MLCKHTAARVFYATSWQSVNPQQSASAPVKMPLAEILSVSSLILWRGLTVRLECQKCQTEMLNDL